MCSAGSILVTEVPRRKNGHPDTVWPQDGVVTFLLPGHYTLHVGPVRGYEANLTFLVNSVPTISSIHVGNLGGISTSVGSKWTATVTIAVHDASHEAVEGAMVSGTWSEGYSGAGSCYTGAYVYATSSPAI